MATLVRSAKAGVPKEPKEKKFKPFSVKISFESREDAMEFADTISAAANDISKFIVAQAYR